MCMDGRKSVVQREMTVSREDVEMLRLVELARHLAFAVAQDYRTREWLLVASHTLFVLDDLAVIRNWLRHYAQCGTYGRRCFVDGQHRCACVPALRQVVVEMPTSVIAAHSPAVEVNSRYVSVASPSFLLWVSEG
jgi:hypothetical protein